MFAFNSTALDRLLPFSAVISADGTIIRAGPSFDKLFPGVEVKGRPVQKLFDVLTPRLIAGTFDWAACPDLTTLQLGLKGEDSIRFKAQVVPLGEAASLLDLALGLSAAEAVRRFDLSASDFAPTTQVVELLYLIEANAAVMEEARRLISRLEGARQIAETSALTDPLTGIANRRALGLRLNELIVERAPFALLQIDLDYFKQVNDRLGHEAGDLVLKSVAEVLSHAIRQSDLAARVGGDEFVLLLKGARRAGALQKIASRIIAQLEQPILVGGEQCRISGSIGIARSSDYAAPEAEQIIRDADTALYRSKRDGRGRACVAAAKST